MPTKRTKAQLEERIAQLEHQLAEAVPVVVVPQAVFDELHQPWNLVEVLERLGYDDPSAANVFWRDHERDLKDPEYREAFVAESRRIAAIEAADDPNPERINNGAMINRRTA